MPISCHVMWKRSCAEASEFTKAVKEQISGGLLPIGASLTLRPGLSRRDEKTVARRFGNGLKIPFTVASVSQITPHGYYAQRSPFLRVGAGLKPALLGVPSSPARDD